MLKVFYYETLQGEKKVLAAGHYHLMLNSPMTNFGEIYTKHCDAQKYQSTRRQNIDDTVIILLKESSVLCFPHTQLC